MQDFTKAPVWPGSAPAALRELPWPDFLAKSFGCAGAGFLLGLLMIAAALLVPPPAFLANHALGLGWLCFLFMMLGNWVIPGRSMGRNVAGLAVFSMAAALLALIIVFKHFHRPELFLLLRWWLTMVLMLGLSGLVLRKQPELSTIMVYLLCQAVALACTLFPFQSFFWLNVAVAGTLPLGVSICLGRLRWELNPDRKPVTLPLWAAPYLGVRLPYFMLVACLNRALYPAFIFAAAMSSDSQGRSHMPESFFLGHISGTIYRDFWPKKEEDLRGIRPGGF
ncbi:MAG: hypothetical protein LBV79_03345 [Candidatus Adiutrix sp.]|jgi:hypothetical protein|nr:hypothetical protein [Candidatus Adiutrix sp.]